MQVYIVVLQNFEFTVLNHLPQFLINKVSFSISFYYFDSEKGKVCLKTICRTPMSKLQLTDGLKVSDPTIFAQIEPAPINSGHL